MQELFQQKVLNDFIEKQDEKLIEQRWQKYKNFLAKKEKISTWIETDYQDGFLEDIFENCLGYVSKTRSTNEHYTLEREKKNETNGQKADGALLVDDKVVAVIELKDQKSKDLEKKYNREESAVRQAFGYLQHNNYAKYVIISNFNELRFYFDKATAYEQFFLFDLDYDGFKKLHMLLSYESISKDIPHAIKDKSLTFEQDISNKLYKDYTAFRSHLFENILKNNLDIDKLELLNATQKLIDRIVFILFGEDTELLPKNTIGTIIQRQKEVKKLVKTFTLYDSYKVYFEAINAGDEDLDITMYNGGLFAEDTLLNKLIIEDEVLDARAKILSAYNFGSDISVNILGHIFENSISELEEISAQLLENDFDKKQSKRKKDGVFYTPAYITEYIVQNTLGKLCEEKRESLFIGSETLVSPKNSKKPTKAEQQIKDNLLIYKDWLLNLKILDPACGSGAFLNQALEYLLKEHKRLQNDLALMGDLFASYEVEKEVLEHNLYGVDINEGAVEIAKLSLWLRTAKRGRPLTKLANKIKVGNSLIDDKTVVPNAFDWHVEFPEVFAQGGFDVVIGNPPYVVYIRSLVGDEIIKYIKLNYTFAEYNPNTYSLFTELAITKLLKEEKNLGFIIPNTWLDNQYFQKMRRNIYKYNVYEVVNLKNEVFNEIVETVVLLIQKIIGKFEIKLTTNLKQNIYRNINMEYEKLVNGIDFFIRQPNPIVEKIEANSIKLKEYAIVYRGLETKNNKVWLSDKMIDENYVQILLGSDVNKYSLNYSGTYVNFIKKEMKSNANESMYSKPKILMRRTGASIIATIDIENYFALKNLYLIIPNQENNLYILLAILNSKLMHFLHTNYSSSENKAFAQFKGTYIDNFPMPENMYNQQFFSHIIKKMLELNKKLQETKQNFTNELGLEKLTKKLQNFETLTFEEFIKEYTKALKLKFADKLAERNFKQEWQAIFENDKTLACGFKTEIQITDKEIDKMVYELYGLSDDEIKIVEGV